MEIFLFNISLQIMPRPEAGESFVDLLKHWKLARNTFISTGAQLMRWGIQAVYFVVIARTLGPAEYGTFLAALAITSIIAPFAQWGMQDRIVRAISKDPAAVQRVWGSALVTIGLVGGALTAALALLAPLLLPSVLEPRLIAMVALADFIGMATVATAASLFQGLERMAAHGGLWLLRASLKAVAAVWLAVSIPEPTALDWGQLWLIASMGAGLIAAVVVTVTSTAPGAWATTGSAPTWGSRPR